MVTIGIDPGKKGALVALFDDDSILAFDLVECYDSEGASQISINPIKFKSLVFNNLETVLRKEVFVCCEKPIFVGTGFTIKTPTSMFESYGVIRAVFDTAQVQFCGVLPKVWLKFYPDLYHPKTKRDKSESIEKAKQLFPLSSDLFERVILKGRNKGKIIGLDGRAEAVLIANYARSVYKCVNKY